MRRILIVPILAIAAVVSAAATSGETQSGDTRKDLLYAMKDEAFSYLKYRMYAAKARENGNVALAELFERTADDEFQKHFTVQASDFGLVKSDKENLTSAISEEYLETAKMYLEMAKRAAAAGESTLAQHFTTAAADESGHHRAFKAMLFKKNAEAAN
jgi:rubrerythrin